MQKTFIMGSNRGITIIYKLVINQIIKEKGDEKWNQCLLPMLRPRAEEKDT